MATTEQQDVVRWRLEVRAASIGGVLTAVVAFVGLAGVGRVSSTCCTPARRAR